jgi:hypothetical protein
MIRSEEGGRRRRDVQGYLNFKLLGLLGHAT